LEEEGGTTSAGQAAVFLAQRAKRLHMLIRSEGLAKRMSCYLIRQIEETPMIVLRPNTEIVTLEGDKHIESIQWRNNQSNRENLGT
jgi:thioredoxin reductase (NADPH)